MSRKIIQITLILIMLLSSICFPIYAVSTSQLQGEKADLNEKIDEAKHEHEELEEQLTKEMEEISKLDAQIFEQEEQIKALTAEISSLEDSISKKQGELDKKQEEFEQNQILMEERLVVMYETGEVSFLDMLFNSKNIVEFISNYYMLSQITECDKELLDTIEKEQQEITQAKNELEEQKARVDTAKKEKVTKTNLLKANKNERQEKANALSAEEKALQAKIDDYNKQVNKIETQIQEAIRQAQASANQSGVNGLKFDGSFIWPCNNKIITSRVKIRWGRWHKGIDIGARYENVYAAASGYAYTMENPGGYGHYIMIIHGDGYITLYAHLDSYNISYGQYVTQGQVIATSGNSGASTGPHLHFEIRKASNLSSFFSSSFLNPLDYLPGGYSFSSGA